LHGVGQSANNAQQGNDGIAMKWEFPKGYVPYNRGLEIKTASNAVRAMIEAVHDSPFSYRHICETAGYAPDSITSWKSGRAAPNVLAVETILETLGYELKVVKKEPAA